MVAWRWFAWSSAPPIGADLLAADDLCRYPGSGGPEFEVIDCDDRLDRLLPGVEGKIEKTPVDRHEQAVIAERSKAANGAFRAHVDVQPERIRGTDLEHGEVEWPKLLADFAKAIPLARVSAVVNAVLWAGQSEGAP